MAFVAGVAPGPHRPHCLAVIPARKNAFAERLMFWQLRRMLRRSFHCVWIRGRENLRAVAGEGAVIAFSNHTNWWDGLLIFLLTRELPEKSLHCMMEEKQLQHYRFFTWIGAFGVNLDSKREAARSLRYALRLLEEPNHLVWIFPQGEMLPPTQPILAHPGVAFLARKAKGARMLPIAFRYEFLRQDKPEVLIEIGEPIAAATTDLAAIEQAAQAVADRLAQTVASQDLSGFEGAMAPSLPINKRWEWFCRACTGRLSGFQAEN